MIGSSARKVAVVGSNPATCELAPFDDPSWDIWVLNEAATTWEPPRISASFQIHKWESFARTDTPLKKDHWEWLQREHPFPVYMAEDFKEVPSAFTYPLEHIIDAVGGRSFFTSSAAYALALAHYMDYQEVGVWGVHVASEWEYEFQREGIAYWLGRIDATAKLYLVPGCGLLEAPLYGYEGATMIDLHYLITSRRNLQEVADEYQEQMDKASGAVSIVLKKIDEAETEDEAEKWQSDLQRLVTQERNALIRVSAATANVGLVNVYIKDLKAMMTAAGEYKETRELEPAAAG